MAVEGQICVGVAGEENRTEVDLQSDGLNPAVHADVPFTWRKAGDGGSERKVGNVIFEIKIKNQDMLVHARQKLHIFLIKTFIHFCTGILKYEITNRALWRQNQSGKSI